jgi:hypothetical protein
MGLKIERFPDPMDRRGREACGFGHRAQAPVGRARRRRLERLTDDLGDLVIADPTRRAGTRLVVNTIHAQLREPPPPFAHRVRGRAEANADVLVVLAFGGKQNDTRPLRQPLRGLSPRR